LFGVILLAGCSGPASKTPAQSSTEAKTLTGTDAWREASFKLRDTLLSPSPYIDTTLGFQIRLPKGMTKPTEAQLSRLRTWLGNGLPAVAPVLIDTSGRLTFGHRDLSVLADTNFRNAVQPPASPAAPQSQIDSFRYHGMAIRQAFISHPTPQPMVILQLSVVAGAKKPFQIVLATSLTHYRNGASRAIESAVATFALLPGREARPVAK
jgi:hypothetical protein